MNSFPIPLKNSSSAIKQYLLTYSHHSFLTMPKPEGVKWNDVDTWKRIVIAMLVVSPDVGSKVCVFWGVTFQIIAHIDQGKLTQVAQHFGATYDTLDNGLREYKKQAKAIRDSEAPNKVIPGAVSRATHSECLGIEQSLSTGAFDSLTKMNVI